MLPIRWRSDLELHNDDIGAARLYHEVTKHSYTSVRVAGHHLDWDNRPLPYKIFPQAGAIALPRDLALPAIPALEAIASPLAPDADRPIDLDRLTRILFCAGGLTRTRRHQGIDYHFRAAASAGALYPIEIYLAAAGIEGLENGLYHFSPGDLKLRGLRRGDWRATLAGACRQRQSVANARAILILSAIFWRSTWKYRARGYRYCFWDAGTLLANLLAAARAEDASAEIVTAFADPEIEPLLGIDGESEGLVCLVPLGRSATPAETTDQSIAPLALETVPLSAEQANYEDLNKFHRASRLLSREEVLRAAQANLAFEPLPEPAGAVSPALKPLRSGLPLGETILRRGATRTFARESIAAEELATILSRSSSHPRCDFPRLSDTYLIVNAVSAMEPGAYYYSRERGTFHLLKAGDFRSEAGYLCLEQALGADCSALVCYMAGLERALGALGNRGYRDAHLEAGLLAGSAWLAAYALGRGATGLTFYDDDTTKFFSPHAAGKSPLLMLALGVASHGAG